MKICQSLFCILLFIFSETASAQTWPVNSNFWTATDALGRKTPTAAETGSLRLDKKVAIFYWTWHCDNLAAFSPVLNITHILRTWPEAANDAAHPAWQGIWGGVFWWDEPLFGYYRTTDEWVLRKHAEMLADAGIDVVFFDCTNASYTWASSYKKLLAVWQQARNDGVKTPQIAFMLPFSSGNDTMASLQELYTELYQPGSYKDLWFFWKGKPIIMAYAESIKAVKSESAAMRFTAVDSFSTVDACCPSWSNHIGNLTLALYKWNVSYAGTLLSPVLAERTFENFTDNARLPLSFAMQGPGTYLWVLRDASEVVGVGKHPDSRDSVVSYFNGMPVSGNYMSRILYRHQANYVDLAAGTASIAAVQIKPGISSTFVNEIKGFFTFRPGQPDYVNGPSRSDHWGWLEIFPQHGYGYTSSSGYEQVPVGVAQNARSASGGHCYAFNAPGAFGRSYTQTAGQDTRPDAYLYGLNFMEQWGRAVQLDPVLVFVTGWNEWIAGRWENWPPSDPYKPFAFPDTYDRERSRDIEPVKSWGDSADVYYQLLVAQVRKFKGMTAQESASAPKAVVIGSGEGWMDIKPEYRHYKGNTLWRNHPGQGDQLIYIDRSGRNDIVLAKVARDENYVYFYAETADPLTPHSDPHWMRLYIDCDRDKSTGWQGYDLLVNRISPTDSAIVEKSESGWNWTRMGVAAYAVHGCTLELQVPRTFLRSIDENKLDFEFKWSDNGQADGQIMDFYLSGDAAPGGRFNFVYQADDLAQADVKTGTELSAPHQFRLLQNYPNPFNMNTIIEYDLPGEQTVCIQVFNLHGERIRTCCNSGQSAGRHRLSWDGLDDAGDSVAGGIYFIRLDRKSVV